MNESVDNVRSFFEEIYCTYHQEIERHVKKLIKIDQYVEDVTEDTFLNAFKALAKGTIIHPNAVRPWLYKIATNKARDHLRHVKVLQFISLYDSSNEAKDILEVYLPVNSQRNFEDTFADSDEILGILQTLPTLYAKSLWLSKVEGFSISEIAIKLNKTEGAIKMTLSRASKSFKRIYNQGSE